MKAIEAAWSETFQLPPSFFGKNGKTELFQKCPSLKCLHFESGEEIYKQGASYPYVAIIQQGKVKLATITANGKEVLVDFRGAGDFLGSELSSTSCACIDTARALSKLTLWRIHVQEFKQLLANDSVIAQNVITILSDREYRFKRKLELTNGATVEARIAYVIQELSKNFDELYEPGLSKHIRMTHQELADMVGASRPTVSLILNKLRQTGILNYDRNYICIKNIDGILRLLNS